MTDEEPIPENSKSGKAKLGGFFGFLLSPKGFLEAVDSESAISAPKVKETSEEQEAASKVVVSLDEKIDLPDEISRVSHRYNENVAPLNSNDNVKNAFGEKSHQVSSLENFYAVLHLRPDAGPDRTEANYLRLSKEILRAISSPETINSPFEEKLTQLALARQVLLDPITKKQYDYNMKNGFESRKNKAELLVEASVIKLETVIRYSKAVSVSRLEEAIQATKDQPQYALAQYLARNGDLDEYDLVSITQAYQLILKGKISLSQFELLFEEARESGTPLWVALVAKGWAKYSDF